MQGPVEIAYYYKVCWGAEREFRELFIKNHLPVLLAQKKTGRFRDVRMYEPKFHGEGRADWHFLVVLSFADWAAVGASVDEEALARSLFADFERFRGEERRRFEILEAHWDVVLKPIDLPQG
jgi:hypothetical protein